MFVKPRILTRGDNVLGKNSPARMSGYTNNAFVTHRAFTGQDVRSKLMDARIPK